jgi:hypothetical protein
MIISWKQLKMELMREKREIVFRGAQTREIRSQASSVSPHQLRENNKITHAFSVYLDKINRIYSSREKFEL